MIIKLTEYTTQQVARAAAVYVNADRIVTMQRYVDPADRESPGYYTGIFFTGHDAVNVTETPEQILSIIAMKGAHS